MHTWTPSGREYLKNRRQRDFMPDVSTVVRPDFNVLARLLERLWKENGPMKKTRLQTGAGVNYDTFIKYLKWMEEHRLVVVSTSDNGLSQVALTEKGTEVCLTLVKFLSDVFDDQTHKN